MSSFRVPAVPLFANDPMFSLWSFSDRLTDDVTRHWTGVRQYISGLLSVDGKVFSFMGPANPDNRRYHPGYPAMRQISCDIRPMTTIYVFEEAGVRLTLRFTSPLLLSDLDVLARPVSYLTYRVESVDGAKHESRIFMGFSGEFCVNNSDQCVSWGETERSVYFTSGKENMLKNCGDDHRIEWGSFHIIAPQMEHSASSLRYFLHGIFLDNLVDRVHLGKNFFYFHGPNFEDMGPKVLEQGVPYQVGEVMPTIVLKQTVCGDCEGHITFAYDDVKCLQYYGVNIDAYWRRNGMSFDALLEKAEVEYSELLERTAEAEDELLTRAGAHGSRYAEIVSLIYRQAVAAHKLAWTGEKLIFISKENFSNGCGATVDVTYPSVPLFLMYKPELVEGMLEPVFDLVKKGLWQYEFAPHDVGTYPLLNGQVYGYFPRHLAKRPNPMDSQMPIEECGNMILCTAAVCRAEGSRTYFEKHREILTQWADYLVKTGYNPENQLCTDDFAGHLAHNCNLSAKAICALGAYAQLLGEDGAPYRAKAEEFAAQWLENADDGDHYRLTFDQPGTWSMKYNMVWDKLLGLKLFPEEVYAKELAYYKKQLQPYGLPMDSRAEYTKSDWQMWVAAMFMDDEEFFAAITDRMHDFLRDTQERLPFTDVYFTTGPGARNFQARSVQAGICMPLLMDMWGGSH
ncbi:MAG: DUF4965 domain-containing protein [Lachnospiraceae bacterium]|nr:DUF4965 domain-containing protein [Lachnospiraceae bacterium]